MTIRQFFSLLAISCLVSCSGKPGASDNMAADTSSRANIQAMDTTSHCFAYRVGKDSAFFRLHIGENGTATGELSYSLFEKDRNRGSFAGKIHGDTIWAKYTFTSEGIASVREIALLKKGPAWIEGFGNMQDSAGTMVFSNRSKLDFEKGLHFEPVECPSATH
ncbi:hypothetical protein [Dyadobacter sp. 676]|uniref:Lipoprotein n=1 Tax=Dyadobacter sp. 676 TaxID=3088362 RepID=A0AAU8FQN6_9BACT